MRFDPGCFSLDSGVVVLCHRIKYEHIPVDMWTNTAVWIRIRKASTHTHTHTHTQISLHQASD